MRVPVIAGNLKMNLTVTESRALIFAISQGIREFKEITRIIFPPFTSLLPVASLLMGTDIALGAQNMHWEEKGAFTGEISPQMVVEFCKYVLIGHSERRAYFNETDDEINKKMHAALRNDLTPIICIGETLSEKETGLTGTILKSQIIHAYQDLEPNHAVNSIIAYEPVWAIGTGKASSGKDASNTIENIIRPAVSELFGDGFSKKIRVLYGGSVTADNAQEILNFDEIDGALVGGASLSADQFIKIVKVCSQV
ncbi:triose-phosphate isomerase [Chloroflexota bacterium]